MTRLGIAATMQSSRADNDRVIASLINSSKLGRWAVVEEFVITDGPTIYFGLYHP